MTLDILALKDLRRYLSLRQIDVENATGISVRRISLAEQGCVDSGILDSEIIVADTTDGAAFLRRKTHFGL